MAPPVNPSSPFLLGMTVVEMALAIVSGESISEAQRGRLAIFLLGCGLTAAQRTAFLRVFGDLGHRGLAPWDDIRWLLELAEPVLRSVPLPEAAPAYRLGSALTLALARSAGREDPLEDRRRVVEQLLDGVQADAVTLGFGDALPALLQAINAPQPDFGQIREDLGALIGRVLAELAAREAAAERGART